MTDLMRIGITGSSGLLGYHARAALHAINANLEFQQKDKAFLVMPICTKDFDDSKTLLDKVNQCDSILHFAGINRASPEEVESGNQAITRSLVDALKMSSQNHHVVYANSTQSELDNPYGRGKRRAAELLRTWAVESGNHFSNIILPHIYGENGKPFYNTVTSTLCYQVVNELTPEIHDGAVVELLHAGEAVDKMIGQLDTKKNGDQRLAGKEIKVQDLYNKISEFKQSYDNNVFPEFSDNFDVNLFNTYRFFEFPHSYPRKLKTNSDDRGTLFEASKGGGGGQTFLSWTNPGVTRGNHYHRYKVERFLVLSGTAEICIRKLFGNEINTFQVSGDNPEAVDMPTLHTHNILNTGKAPLLTLFWTNEIFDPNVPDTYVEQV